MNPVFEDGPNRPDLPTITLTPEGQLALARALARLMDDAFEIPGTRIRFGLDSIIGLLPGVGDLLGSMVGGYIVLVGSQMGVPRAVVWRMMWNLGVDTAIGIVPVFGDMLDVAWKANIKNVALIEQALADPVAARRGSVWMLVAIVAGLLLLGAAGTTLLWLLIRTVISPVN